MIFKAHKTSDQKSFTMDLEDMDELTDLLKATREMFIFWYDDDEDVYRIEVYDDYRE